MASCGALVEGMMGKKGESGARVVGAKLATRSCTTLPVHTLAGSCFHLDADSTADTVLFATDRANRMPVHEHDSDPGT